MVKAVVVQMVYAKLVPQTKPVAKRGDCVRPVRWDSPVNEREQREGVVSQELVGLAHRNSVPIAVATTVSAFHNRVILPVGWVG